MLFYRRDILHDINLAIPRTWEDVEAALSVLNRNHMQFGIPIAEATGMRTIDTSFAMFLFQQGGEFYTYDGRASALDTDIAISAFRDFTRYFIDHRLLLAYDFINVFRTGEMPLAIADYTNYNRLQVFAPEIAGMWGFTKVPGTLQPDGSIDHSVATSGSAAVIMERSVDKKSAWEFLKWWVSAETQTQYGRAMETLMGPAARYPTANQEAFTMLPWPVRDFRNIREQFQYAIGIPQVPGGYFTPRQITNAFYRVHGATIGPREALTHHTRYINEEINFKRREFNLD